MLRSIVVAITLSIVIAVPASAQVMYKCNKNDLTTYSFQAMPSADCSALTMAEAYREGVVQKDLALACSGVSEVAKIGYIPDLIERELRTFHFKNGQLNRIPCWWSATSISCGSSVDPSGYPDLLGQQYLGLDRFSGAVNSGMRVSGTEVRFKGTCEIKTKAKF